MRCIAIDDEPLALKLLQEYCRQIPSIRLLGTYTDSVEALTYIRSLSPDLIFLDIHMPDLSGMDIAGSLNKNTLVIFTTAYKEYAVEGFELDVVDYLLKPFDFNRFLKAYTKAEERFQTALKKLAPEVLNDEIVTFKCNYQNVKLPLHTIQYVEGFDNYIKIVTQEKTYMPVMTMKHIERLLPEKRFVRVHKSFIIPVAKIKSFNHERVITNGIEVPVGRTYRREFMEKMEGLKRGK
ncbi:MAG: response regulator transcription factor [Dysgonamonadaceae bacterium]|jgi:DNA-binding LytR/AlgR family response regulator|nr:response regulator transcription factor [Dysgonamonadaceae bacterium]